MKNRRNRTHGTPFHVFLFVVGRRFDRGDIYTFTANAILLAVNPFKRLPLYSKELLTEYFNMGYMRQQGIEPPKALGPHVFAIADSAYRDMMKVLVSGDGGGSCGGRRGVFPILWGNGEKR